MADAENQILIVDDEPAMREVLVTYFEGREWIVHTANDGIQAIRSVRDLWPDILYSWISQCRADTELPPIISLEKILH